MQTWFVSVALFGWIPVVLLLFTTLPPRRAVIVAFLTAWLFLPLDGVKLGPGIPIYDKMSATCVGVMLGVLVFDTKRLGLYRFHWIDLPIMLWCLCPFASSLANGLGPYDGVSAVFRQTVEWGLPYVIGRLYFSNLAGLKELAIGVFIGGLIYVPLCLFEIRMSPQLYNWVYGQHPSLGSFAESLRFGGWRPTVFMQHGLMVAMWMCMSGLIGLWLWYGRAYLKFWRSIPTIWLALGLLGTAVLCKSTGAIVLLLLGTIVLWLSVRLNTKLLIWCLILAAPLYCAVRAGGMWDGSQLVKTSARFLGEERADSLETRLHNEDILAAKALKQPAFGWGGWGRARVYDEMGNDVSITDGLWIIALGDNGIVGLASLTLAMLLPTALLLRRYPPRTWRDRDIAPAIVLAVVVVLYWIDCIPNGMENPIFTLAVGGLASALALPRQLGRVAARPVQQIVRPTRVMAH